MKTTSKTAEATTTKRSFMIQCYTKKQLTAELGFSKMSELDKAMKEKKQFELLKKEGWYYNCKQVEDILFALGKIKAKSVIRFAA